MLVGLDFRPLNGQLYAVSNLSRLYTINASNGAATFVAMLSVNLSGTSFGFDFNPLVDRIRIVSNTGQNLRVNPLTGAAIADGMINPGTPSVTAAAYTNNFAGTTSTALYVIDNDKLFIQNPPNAGTLTQVGPLGITAGVNNGFDIGGTSNIAYGIFTSGSNTSLYTINLSNGMATMSRAFSNMVSGFTIGLGF
jgi:hypothetical protein